MMELHTLAGRKLLEVVEHLEGFDWKGAIAAIEAEAESMGEEVGVTLGRPTEQEVHDSRWHELNEPANGQGT